MSKNEIRLRRQKMTARGADRFRNYGAVLHRVEEEKRIKKIIRVFGYFLVILILIMMLIIVIRVERKSSQSKGAPKQTSSVQIRRSDSLIAIAQHSIMSPISNGK
ncbi:MAG: hypothetical protein JNN04_04265 [Cyclobacteriaceae bacterium]|nr:hypothetical protein [Cyclobacteriaceae bacterium]